MAKRLFIGNISWGMKEADVQQAFAQYGAEGVTIPTDQQGRSKGFAFVDVPDDQADAAIQEMNGREIDGRPIVVNEARPREERGPRQF